MPNNISQTAPLDRAAENFRDKPVGQVVEDLMHQSHEVLERGVQVTAELEELKRRAQEATDWRKQLNKHSGALLGITAGFSFLMYLGLRRY